MKENKRPLEAYLSFGLLLAMTIILFIGVIARYVFNSSLSWSEELTRYMFIWFIFISMSYAVTQKAHIRVDSLNKIVPLKIRPYINIIGKVIWFILSLLVTYLGIMYAKEMTTSVSASMRLPMSIVYLGIPIGYFLMSIRLLVQIIASIKNPQLEVEEISEAEEIKEEMMRGE